jgi:hypothetical protein
VRFHSARRWAAKRGRVVPLVVRESSSDPSLVLERRQRERATHCPKGHPYAGENLYLSTRGKKKCRACHRERERKRSETEAYKLRAAQRRKGNAFKDRTHCPRGHPYEGENLYVRPNGGRKCRTCNRDAERERHRRASA